MLRNFIRPIFILFLLSFSLVSNPLWAKENNAQTPSLSPIVQIEEELKENNRAVQTLRQKLSSQQFKESEIIKNLNTVEQELKDLMQDVLTLEKQITQNEQELKSLEDTLAASNHLFQQKLQSFAKQMKATYYFKKNSPLKLFLSKQNPYQIHRILHYYRFMEKHHYEMLSHLLNEMHLLSLHQNEYLAMDQKIKSLKLEKSAFIETKKAEIHAQHKVLSTLTSEASQIQSALALSKQNEQALLSKLANIQKLEQETTPTPKSRSLLPFFKPSAFSKAEGKLFWPIRKEPKPSLMSPFMIKAQEGEPVHATYEGRVVFADKLRGFGLLMIIDHGEGYLSLYGQNQVLYKNTGDIIKRGEVLGRVGIKENSKSELNNSGLYFEIRKNGKPINLVNWFN